MSQRTMVITLFIIGQTHVTGFAYDVSLCVIEVISRALFFVLVIHLLLTIKTIPHVTSASMMLNKTGVVVATVLHVVTVEIIIDTNNNYMTQ